MDDEVMNEPTDEAIVDAPESKPSESAASLVLKRDGAETDIAFTVHPPAVIGRFDPTVGPIDIDLGGLPEGTYISRRHAKVVHEDGAWMLQDLGSSNGTFVLGPSDFERQENIELHDGTEIALGNARFVFHLKDEPPAVMPSPTLEAEAIPEEPAEAEPV